MRKAKFSFWRLKDTIVDFLSPMALPVIVGVAATGLLGYHLLRLVPFGPSEQAHRLGSATLSAIKNDTLFGPIKGVQIFILKFTENDIYIRLASVAVGVTAAVILYTMLRKWYTARVSFLTSMMFITSSWFLHEGRLANLDVLYLTTLPAVLVAFMLLISKRNDRKLPIAAVLIALTLYSPGSWLFILFGAVAIRKAIFTAVKPIDPKIKIFGAFAFLVTLLPLIYSFALKPSQLVRWLGFDTSQELSVRAIGSNFLDIPKQLFLAGPDDPSRWLVGTPILDIFTAAMVVLGLYAYATGYYASRQKLVFGSIIISVIFIGVGNVATLSLLIPVLYITVANGIAYMLQSWFTVFPRNPVARSIGITLLVLVIAGSCFYQLQRYFVAWPNADDTKKSLISEG